MLVGRFQTISYLFYATMVLILCYAAVLYRLPILGRFQALLDPVFSTSANPVIASISEHRPSAWSSFFLDTHLMLVFIPVGTYFCFEHLENDTMLFSLLFCMTSMYFASVMHRLMAIFAPAGCLLSAIGISKLMSTFSLNPTQLSRTRRISLDVRWLFMLLLMFVASLYVAHSTFVAYDVYANPTIIRPGTNPISGEPVRWDDFREAYAWLRFNTEPDAKKWDLYLVE